MTKPDAVFVAQVFTALIVGSGWLAVGARRKVVPDNVAQQVSPTDGIHKTHTDNSKIQVERVVLEGFLHLQRGSFWAATFGVVGTILSAVAAGWSAL
jgi:hypothetical protein